MLCLSRHVGEKILIGDEIEITVISINRGKVRIGIHAPREIVVHRGELRDAIEAKRRTGEEAGKA